MATPIVTSRPVVVTPHVTVTPHATVTPKASVTPKGSTAPKSNGSTGAKSGSKAPSSSETSKGTTKSETKAQNGSHSTGKAIAKQSPHDFTQYSAANSNMYSNTYKDYNTVGYCGNNAFNTTFPYLWLMNNSNHTTTATTETIAPVEESHDMELGDTVVAVVGITLFVALIILFVYCLFGILRR